MLPFHWKSALPRNYKKNVIARDLHSANKINSDLEEEISIIKAKYLKAVYPNEFIDSLISNFHQTKEDFLIPVSLFEEWKKIRFQVPKRMKRIICKLEEYANNKKSLGIHGKLENYDYFPIEISYYSQIECYLKGNMYMQRILFWRNQM